MSKILELFFIYLKIGTFTIGGGYAMIPLIQQEIVERKQWMTEDEFMDMFVVIQSAPGPIAVNSAVFLGYKIGGIPGAIVASLGSVLPSFIIILTIAIFFRNFREYSVVEKIFKGVRPAVVALIASAVYKLAKASRLNTIGNTICIISLLMLIFFHLSPILLLIIGAICGIFISNHETTEDQRREKK
ncbi:chromate transporter [Garciella nitratireducens]|uniref:chromate transporter n=1 Tax=Garciella nitratireducens TaxID=218205 RepID=UPI001BD3B429|nr:chromate transporter [Garciella nitratireducens]